MELIDGKKVAEKVRAQLKTKIDGMTQKPGLAVVQIGNNPASSSYVNSKVKMCAEIGVYSEKHHFDDISEKDLLELIDKLCSDEKIDGVLVQLPLPDHIDTNKILEAIPAEKDVDGFHAENIGKLSAGLSTVESCTPKGIMKLLEAYNVDLSGKTAVVIGRSNIVGKPIAMMLLNSDATVTVCHSKTKDLAAHTKGADIIVAAVGRPGLVTADMVKKGVVIIDVGTTKVEGKLKGDVDFDTVSAKASLITPVPGGVGPMTIAMLLQNTVSLAEMHGKK